MDIEIDKLPYTAASKVKYNYLTNEAALHGLAIKLLSEKNQPYADRIYDILMNCTRWYDSGLSAFAWLKLRPKLYRETVVRQAKTEAAMFWQQILDTPGNPPVIELMAATRISILTGKLRR